MELLLAVRGADDDVEELHSLFEALVEDDELRVGRFLEPGRAHAETLGAEEIIRIVAESAPLWGAVAACVTAWLQTHKPKLTLTVTRPDGVTMEIQAEGGRAVEAAQVEQAIALAHGATDEAS